MAGFKSRPGSKELPNHKPMHVESQPIAPAHQEPTTADMDQIEAYANDPANATQPDASEGEGPSNAPDTSADSGPGSSSGQPQANTGGRVQSADSGTNQRVDQDKKPKGDDKKTNGGGKGGKADTGAQHGPAEPPGSRPLTKGEKFDKGLSEAMGNPGDSTAGSRLFGKGKKQKRTGIKIAIISAALILSAVGFFLTFPLKLMHIASVLFNNNFRVNDHIEIRAERNIIRSLFIRQVNDTTGHKSNTGRFLRDKLTNMRIEKFKDILAKEGLKMEFDKNNKFLGVRDKDGKLINDFRDKNLWEQKRAMGELVRSKLAPHRWLQHALYTKAMRLHAGVSFKFWTKDKTRTLKERMVSKVRRGLSGDADLAKPTAANQSDPNNQAEKGLQGTASEQAGQVEGAQAKTWEVWEKTQDIMKAHEAGIKEFRLRALRTVGWTGIVAMYCMLYEMYQQSIEKGYLDRVIFLMREGNMIVTMAHHMYTGQEVNFDEFGELMSRFDGNPNAGINPERTGITADSVLDPDSAKYSNDADDTKDFTQSCAWKRAMDAGACSTSVRPEDYDNYNPDLNPAANPDSFALTGVLSIMSAAFKLPPAGEAVCKVLTSWFSWVIQGVEVALSIWVGGVTTVAAQAIKGALVGMLVQLVVPKLLDAATGLAITGSENAVGLINNSDAGLNLSAKNYGRFMGNRTGTNKENYKLIAAAKAEEIEYANDQGWTYRAFALSNNHSLVNRVISQTPSTGTGMLAAIQSSLKSLPTNFAAAFLKPRTALAEGDEMEDPYGFRPYVTTDDELSKYPDPVDDIEDYLYQEVTKDDGSKTTRLQMLGDPKDYTPADGEDTDTTNLRHCFVGKFRAPTKEAADPICLDLGVLTQRDGVTNKIITNPRNPGRHEIKQLIYCEVHQACGVSYNDDFEKYRLYLKYVFLTKAMDGMTTDKDPFAGTGNNPAISETYGICETPAKGSDPGAPVPPNNYSRTTIDGKTVNMRTKFMYDQALKYARQLGYNGPLYVVQGSYHPGVGASEGTHDGGGALDISVNGMTGGQRTIVVTALRMAGFAAWNRGQPYDSAFVPHIHAMAIGDRDITHAIAKDQISDYFLHRSGLSGDGPDQDAKSGYPFPDWAGQICMSMGLAG